MAESGQFRIVPDHGGSSFYDPPERFVAGAEQKRYEYQQWLHPIPDWDLGTK